MRHFLSKLFYKAQFCHLLRLIPDCLYLKIHTLISLGYWPDLKNPKLFNEKLQWLKLHDRNPLYTKLVDKYEVKNIVSEKIGDEYIIPTLAVWNTFDEIDFDTLPDKFVLKCTHDSGGVVIVKDKQSLNLKNVEKKINECMSLNYYWLGREWAYKNVKPRIIAEEYIEPEGSGDLRDYKFFCFNGKVMLIQVDFDRFSEHKRNIYDTKWNYIPAFIHYPTHPEIKISCPENLDEMILIAEKLSHKIPFLRVDLYNVNGHIYFGELTFYHGSGFEIIRPESFEYQLGEYIECIK